MSDRPQSALEITPTLGLHYQSALAAAKFIDFLTASSTKHETMSLSSPQATKLAQASQVKLDSRRPLCRLETEPFLREKGLTARMNWHIVRPLKSRGVHHVPHKGADMKRIFLTTVAVAVTIGIHSLFTLAPLSEAQSRTEKREQKIEESAKPRSLSGGVTFQVEIPYDKTYESSLNYLKRQDYTLDSASKETGQIVTAMTIKGGYSQTGTRVYVTLIKDSDNQTTIKVSVAEQKRKKFLQTEPWGDPKVNAEKSKKLAEDLKARLNQ
ncbi:MAG: hypothetical protein AABM67_14650 [Acidobacteriota bacterium]